MIHIILHGDQDQSTVNKNNDPHHLAWWPRPVTANQLFADEMIHNYYHAWWPRHSQSTIC